MKLTRYRNGTSKEPEEVMGEKGEAKEELRTAPKRKASLEPEHDEPVSPKRRKTESEEDAEGKERAGPAMRKSPEHPVPQGSGSSPSRAAEHPRDEAEPRREETHQAREVAPQQPERRQASRDEEKKRGKRLFGGLLNTLSQSGNSSHNRRRQEIEQRQHEKARQQRIEEDRRRAERVARVTEVRMREQIDFDWRVVSGHGFLGCGWVLTGCR